MYELITCVRRANENGGNLISVVQFLITRISLLLVLNNAVQGHINLD